MKNISAIIFISIASSIITLSWVNRYEIYKYDLRGFDVYVKENRITGKRCTLREGILGQEERANIRTAQNFPNWCK